MENQPESETFTRNPPYTTATDEITPLIAPFSGSNGKELGITDRPIELRVHK